MADSEAPVRRRVWRVAAILGLVVAVPFVGFLVEEGMFSAVGTQQPERFCNLGAPLGSVPEGWEWRNDPDCNLHLANEAGRRAPASVYRQMEFPIDPPPSPGLPMLVWVTGVATAVLLGGALAARYRSRRDGVPEVPQLEVEANDAGST